MRLDRRRFLHGPPALALLGAAALAGLTGPEPALAARVGTNLPAPPLNAARLATLAEPERSAWAAYLAATARQLQADRAALAAERGPGTPVPAPPPSGKSEASMPLDRPMAWYGSDDALRVAENIVSFQTPAGGWGKNQARDQPPRLPGQSYVANGTSRFARLDDFDQPADPAWSYVGTIDNDATTTEIRFLALVQAQLPAQQANAYRASAIRGVQYLLAAQFPGGGWPQVWPLQGGYHDAVTLNDDAMTGVAALLGEVARGEAPFAFVPQPLRAQSAAAELRAIDKLLALQVRVNGRPMLWAQQHDALTGAPVSARNYEPPGLCASESAGVLLYLMSLDEPSLPVVQAVEGGIAALRELELQGVTWGRQAGEADRSLQTQSGARGLWARFYDTQTLKPVFGDRDKSLHDDVAGVSAERRNGYAWFVTVPKKALQAHEGWAKRWLRNRP